jgi:hypothetical protein
MEEPTTKAELLAIIHLEAQTLLAQVDQLTPAEQETPGVNAEWAVKDLLTHLTAWEQLFLGWYQAGVSGERPVTPAPGFTWGPKSLGQLNQSIFVAHHHLSAAEATQTFARSHEQVVALIQTLSEEELFTPARYGWLGKATVAASIRANTYNHYRWATKLIRQWQKRKDKG